MQRITKHFLLTPGKLHCKVWLDKNIYFPGNTVIAKLEANNTSVKPTNKINVMVVKDLKLHANGQHWERRFEIYKQHYKGFDPCYYGVKWLPFQVPIDILPSTTTAKHIQCFYYFVVECDIPGAIDLQVNLPTAIMAPQWLYSTHPQPPPMAILPPDVSFRPPWQPDEQAPKCNKCGAGFSLFNRRHHCRHCGKVYCKNCSQKITKIPNLGYTDEAVKVCDDCFSAASQGGTLFQVAPTLPVSAPQEYAPVLAPIVDAPPPVVQ